MDLYNEILAKQQDLNISIKTLRRTATEYADAYRNYRVALAKELLKLKEEGMAVTIAYDIARGKEEIAHLKYLEICKEGIYKANLEAINVFKLEIKILESQIEREYRSDLPN